ncbi:hypothetical protein ACL6C3_23045 [Capilliphycus salinus ALCB114379]
MKENRVTAYLAIAPQPRKMNLNQNFNVGRGSCYETETVHCEV